MSLSYLFNIHELENLPFFQFRCSSIPQIKFSVFALPTFENFWLVLVRFLAFRCRHESRRAKNIQTLAECGLWKSWAGLQSPCRLGGIRSPADTIGWHRVTLSESCQNFTFFENSSDIFRPSESVPIWQVSASWAAEAFTCRTTLWESQCDCKRL